MHSSEKSTMRSDYKEKYIFINIYQGYCEQIYIDKYIFFRI